MSDEIILGYDNPIILEISEKEFHIYEEGDSSLLGIDEVYQISEVGQDGETIVIFFKEGYPIGDIRYSLNWGIDNFLYVNQVIPPGTNDEIRPMGKI